MSRSARTRTTLVAKLHLSETFGPRPRRPAHLLHRAAAARRLLRARRASGTVVVMISISRRGELSVAVVVARAVRAALGHRVDVARAREHERQEAELAAAETVQRWVRDGARRQRRASGIARRTIARPRGRTPRGARASPPLRRTSGLGAVGDGFGLGLARVPTKPRGRGRRRWFDGGAGACGRRARGLWRAAAVDLRRPGRRAGWLVGLVGWLVG